MPSILKIRIISATNLQATYPALAVEILLDSSIAPLHTSFISSSNNSNSAKSTTLPFFEWNDDFRFEISDDSVLQDSPLELRIVGKETVVGTVFIDLNPLVVENGVEQLAGIFDIQNVGMGTLGQLSVQVRLEVFGDKNPWRTASTEVEVMSVHDSLGTIRDDDLDKTNSYSSYLLPDGRRMASIVGLVDATFFVDLNKVANSYPGLLPSLRYNPAYTLQRHSFGAVGKARRLLGSRAQEIHANAVIGLQLFFDHPITTNSSVTTSSGSNLMLVRALGVGVQLKGEDGTERHIPNREDMATPGPSSEGDDRTLLLDDDIDDARDMQPGSSSHALPVSGPGSTAMLLLHHPQSATAIPLLTITRLPEGSLRSIGTVVSAKTVKILSGLLMRSSTVGGDLSTSSIDKFLLKNTKYQGSSVASNYSYQAPSLSVMNMHHNMPNLETCQEWFEEVRQEIREHARLLRCNVVFAYTEQICIYGEVFLIMAHGTAARCDFGHFTQLQYDEGELHEDQRSLQDEHHEYKHGHYHERRLSGTTENFKVTSRQSSLTSSIIYEDLEDKEKASPVTNAPVSSPSTPSSSRSKSSSSSASKSSSVEEERRRLKRRRKRFQRRVRRHAIYARHKACFACHLPYRRARSPFPAAYSFCRLCRRRHVPEFILSTTQLPTELGYLTETAILVEAFVVRALEGHGTSTVGPFPINASSSPSNAIALHLSTALPFVEYELHRQLLLKLRLFGCNSCWSLKYRLILLNNTIIAMAFGTAIHLLALPQPEPLKCQRTLQLEVGHPAIAIEESLEVIGVENEKRIKELLQEYRNHYEANSLSSGSSSSSSSSSDDSSASDSSSTTSSSSSSDASSSSTSSSFSADPLSFIQIDDETDMDLLFTMHVSNHHKDGRFSTLDARTYTKGEIVQSRPVVQLKAVPLDTLIQGNAAFANVISQLHNQLLDQISHSASIECLEYQFYALDTQTVLCQLTGVEYIHKDSINDGGIPSTIWVTPASHVPRYSSEEHIGHISLHLIRELPPSHSNNDSFKFDSKFFDSLANESLLANAVFKQVLALGGNALTTACLDYVHIRELMVSTIGVVPGRTLVCEMGISGDVLRLRHEEDHLGTSTDSSTFELEDDNDSSDH